MSYTGTWIITLHAPTGVQTLTFTAAEENGTLSGTVSNGTDSANILNGRTEGDDARWDLPIKKPLPLILAFSATREDNTLNGQARVGGLGSAKFSAIRDK
jgi:hypothetical protein